MGIRIGTGIRLFTDTDPDLNPASHKSMRFCNHFIMKFRSSRLLTSTGIRIRLLTWWESRSVSGFLRWCRSLWIRMCTIFFFLKSAPVAYSVNISIQIIRFWTSTLLLFTSRGCIKYRTAYLWYIFKPRPRWGGYNRRGGGGWGGRAWGRRNNNNNNDGFARGGRWRFGGGRNNNNNRWGRGRGRGRYNNNRYLLLCINKDFFMESGFDLKDNSRSNVEVKEIILAKIHRFCQLLSHCCGYRILNPKGLAYGFLWRTRHHPYDTNTLPKSFKFYKRCCQI
jgi:hypothetical protein